MEKEKVMENEIVVLEKESTQIVDQANAHVIEHQEGYERTSVFLIAIKDLKKKINDTFNPIIKKAHEAHKEAKAQQNKHLHPVEEAEKIVKAKIRKYEDECEQKRLADEAIARKEAEKKEEEEKDRIMKEAEKAIDSGDTKQAEELINKADQHIEIADSVVPTIDRVKGLGIRRTWGFRISDPYLIPRQYLQPDMVKIGQVVRAEKKDTKITGVEVFEK